MMSTGVMIPSWLEGTASPPTPRGGLPEAEREEHLRGDAADAFGGRGQPLTTLTLEWRSFVLALARRAGAAEAGGAGDADGAGALSFATTMAFSGDTALCREGTVSAYTLVTARTLATLADMAPSALFRGLNTIQEMEMRRSRLHAALVRDDAGGRTRLGRWQRSRSEGLRDEMRHVAAAVVEAMRRGTGPTEPSADHHSKPLSVNSDRGGYDAFSRPPTTNNQPHVASPVGDTSSSRGASEAALLAACGVAPDAVAEVLRLMAGLSGRRSGALALREEAGHAPAATHGARRLLDAAPEASRADVALSPPKSEPMAAVAHPPPALHTNSTAPPPIPAAATPAAPTHDTTATVEPYDYHDPYDNHHTGVVAESPSDVAEQEGALSQRGHEHWDTVRRRLPDLAARARDDATIGDPMPDHRGAMRVATEGKDKEGGDGGARLHWDRLRQQLASATSALRLPAAEDSGPATAAALQKGPTAATASQRHAPDELDAFVAAALADGRWKEHAAPDGRAFFSSPATKETTWDLRKRLTDECGDAVLAQALASGVWREVAGKDGRPYYYCSSTKETTWDLRKKFIMSWKR